MQKIDEKLQKQIEECSGKSESELIDELKKAKADGAKIDASGFDEFKAAILPMLSEEQIKKLEELKKMFESD